MKEPRSGKAAAQTLESALQSCLRLLATTLQPSTMKQYQCTVRLFLDYLRQSFPAVSKVAQLRRDPHLLGWLEYLWKRRTLSGERLRNGTRASYVINLRNLLEMLSELPQPPAAGLLKSSDVPRREQCLPRPLSPEQDARLQAYWREATDLLRCTLLLQRLTGMRIGECADLRPDCLRHLGDNRWTLHVPHGKPQSERWVPADDQVRVLVERLCFLRTLPPRAEDRYLLPRPGGRQQLLSRLRQTLHGDAEALGIEGHVVPHQLRHTYATTLLRAGVSLPALMKLLGHHNANMTLLYVEVTQQDLQREFQQARLHPRHAVPIPVSLRQPSEDVASLAAVCAALEVACRGIELYGKGAGAAHGKPLQLLSRRLLRVRSRLQKLAAEGGGQK